jgi:hypothetical protein
MPRRKRRFTKEEMSERRKFFYRATKREKEHNCSLGSCVLINEIEYFVVATTIFFIFLVNERGDIAKISWENWDKLPDGYKVKKKIRWIKRIIKAIRVLKRQIKFAFKLRKIESEKIKKSPIFRKEPLIKKKKKKRRKSK